MNTASFVPNCIVCSKPMGLHCTHVPGRAGALTSWVCPDIKDEKHREAQAVIFKGASAQRAEQPKDALRIVPPGTTLHTCGPNAPEDCEGVLSHATMIELESVHVPVIRAAFSRGRHIGHRDTREKYEKMLEIMDERVNLWRTRAKTALGESKHETHLEGCGCGGFDRTASHSAGEYVGYCAQQTAEQPQDALRVADEVATAATHAYDLYNQNVATHRSSNRAVQATKGLIFSNRPATLNNGCVLIVNDHLQWLISLAERAAGANVDD